MLAYFKREWRFLGLTAICTSLVTVLLVFAVAGFTGGAARDLADRVDRNVAVTKAGVDTLVCILAIKPENRTDRLIRHCMEAHGYAPYFTTSTIP